MSVDCDIWNEPQLM